jgi:TPR repeat protein
MNAKLFINYRREDTAPYASRLYDRLTAHFGEDQVFIDIDEIEQGEDFVEAINRKIGTCDIALVLIGSNWLRATDASGNRRLDDEEDFVRMEIVAALRRNIRVIPVLVGGAHIPRKQDLPEALEPLSRRNAIELSETRFHADVNRLIEAIEKFPAVADVFVSHSTLDREWVEREIIALLKRRGLKPWYSKQSINTASQWEREIVRGLESCQWFLIVVSPRAAESEWVKDELNWAISNRPTRIVPVIMEWCDLLQFHLRLPRIQHVDFTTGKRSARNQLVEAFTNLSFAVAEKAASVRLTDQGHAAEQFNLGLRYAEGDGVPKDLGKAAELYQKAADQGHALAQFNLGSLYHNGQGVPKDLRKAVKLYQKAAKQGDASALASLGRLYQSGEGVPKDLGKAVELYQKAAKQGDADALTSLGYLYQSGEGVPKDLGKAEELYQKAADQGDADALTYLGYLGNDYEYGRGVPKDLRKAVELYQKAADRGDASALVSLGSLYESGEGVPRDFKKAQELYQKAADLSEN